MRVLVCGGRDFNDWDLLEDRLGALHADQEFTLLIHGAAPGADSMAAGWAALHAIPTRRFAARWQDEGRAAGPLRNQRMIDHGKPDLVVAFPGGRGTLDLITRARRAGIPIVEVN